MRSFLEDDTVVAETFESLVKFRLNPRHLLKWDCPFVLPWWLQAWWDAFSGEMTPLLCSVRHGDQLVGLAPMMRQGDGAAFMGSPDVCDYFDFVLVPGQETVFFQGFIKNLGRLGISRLDLGPVRADSSVFTVLMPLAESLGCEATCEQVDVSLELDLPSTWDDFLAGLTGKERHEVRRKIRRLEHSTDVRQRVLEEPRAIEREMDRFLGLLRASRPEKRAFMTPDMAAFFHSLAGAMAEAGLVKLFFLDLDDHPAAAAFCFDYQDTVYLYNSGYEPQYRRLSAGLLNKIFSIQESIVRGRKKYDFLKGAEAYKYRLGGRAVSLHRCRIGLA